MLYFFGRLTQQSHVDESRLNYILLNQDRLGCETYRGLQDSLQSGRITGMPFILPSNFKGSPRYMYQNYQDAMAMVRALGKPTYFITFTCNSDWEDVKTNIMDGQTTADRAIEFQ